MVKKMFKCLLMVTIVLVATSMFYSCKDYEDEIYAGMNQNREEMLDNVATLEGYIDALEQKLAHQVDSLGQAQLACKDACAQARQQLRNAIDSLATAHNADKDALQKDITDALDRIAALEAADVILGERIDSVKNDLAQVKNDLQQEIDDNASAIQRDSILIEENKKAIEALQTLTSDYATVKQTAADALALANNAMAKADENETAIGENEAAIQALKDIIGNEDALDGTLVSNILGALNAASSAMDKAKNNEAAIEALIKNYDAAIEELQDIDALIVKDLFKIKDQVAQNEEAIEDLADDIVAAQAAAVELSKAYTDEVVGELNDTVSVLKANLKELKEASEKADSILQDQIDSLVADVAAIEARVKANEDNIAKIFDVLKKQVTSIIAQATVNDVFGSFALPGIQPNILAAYYGQVVNAANFPCVNSTTGLLSQDLADAISQDVADKLGLKPEKFDAGQTLFDGKAGTLYMTVNPNTVDFTDETVTLVNSLDEESPVKLSPLQPSNYKISFGFTRATANGFYEAEATIDETELDDAKMRFELEGIKEIVKDVMTPSDINLTKVASTIMEQLSDFADAHAIKATWEDSLGSHSVYSQYNIAALAVKPLAFSFMKDVEISSVPGLDRVENALNNIMDKIEINIPPINTNIVFPPIQQIELLDVNDLDEAKLKIELKKDIEIKGQTITIKKEDVTFAGGTTMDKDVVVTTNDTIITVEVTKSIKDLFVDVYGDVNASLENVNDMLTNLEITFDGINDMLEDLEEINNIGDQITDFTQSIKNELSKYLDKINNAAVNAVKSINSYIQPTLLLKTDGSFVQLSKSKYAPTKVNAADIELLPTTKTAEMIAPAYKKYVAVTDGPADLAAANSGEGLNTVYSGPRTFVSVNLAEEGTVYELTYAAMDYAGNVVQNKYYVKLVK